MDETGIITVQSHPLKVIALRPTSETSDGYINICTAAWGVVYGGNLYECKWNILIIPPREDSIFEDAPPETLVATYKSSWVAAVKIGFMTHVCDLYRDS